MITHNFNLVNMDTDSISFCKPDGAPFTEQEQIELLKDLNSNYPDKIRFEHDGIFPVVCVLKTKNYILLDEKGKLKKKGSSLKSSKIEKGLSDLMDQIIHSLVFDKQDQLLPIYHKFIIEAHKVTDISRWTSKRTITSSVLKPTRTNEQKQLDALNGQDLQMGNKFHIFFTNELYQGKKDKFTLKLAEHWNNDHNVMALVKKIYKTLLIFKNVINLDQFPKYHLKNKKIKAQLEELLK